MDFLRPASWEEALAAKAEHPTAVPIAGGTDVMVEINFDHRRPDHLTGLGLGRLGGPAEREVREDSVRRDARVPYSGTTENPRAELPDPALASPAVAPPRIRDHLIPTIVDTPAVPAGVLELAGHHAPSGLRGVDEAPTLSSTPAVLAAIRDATGRELNRTPVRPEHLTGTP